MDQEPTLPSRACMRGQSKSRAAYLKPAMVRTLLSDRVGGGNLSAGVRRLVRGYLAKEHDSILGDLVEVERQDDDRQRKYAGIVKPRMFSADEGTVEVLKRIGAGNMGAGLRVLIQLHVNYGLLF